MTRSTRSGIARTRTTTRMATACSRSSEVHVDSRSSTSATACRAICSRCRTASTSSAASCASDAVRLQGRRQHAGWREQLPVQHGPVRVPRNAGSDGAARPAGARDRQDVRHDDRRHDVQDLAPATSCNDQFWKFRELSAIVQLPDRVTTLLRAQNGSTIVFAARNIHTWTQVHRHRSRSELRPRRRPKSRTSSRPPARRRTSRFGST